MNLPFPHITEHRQYSATFLLEVEWRVHFSLTQDVQAYPFFRDFVRSVFGFELRLQDFLAMSIIPLKYSRRGKAVKVKLTDHFAEFKFDASAYSSFVESVLPLLDSFLEMIAQTCSHIEDIVCNKKNHLMIRRAEPTDETTLLPLVFSESLLNYPSYLLKEADLEKDMSPSAHLINIASDDSSLQIVYGVYFKDRHDSDSSEKDDSEFFDYGVMMEAQRRVVVPPTGNIHPIGIAKMINDEMYDLFRWSFGSHVYEAMDSKPTNE